MPQQETQELEILGALLGAAAHLEKLLDRSLSNIKGISYREYQLLRALQGEHNATATRVDLADLVGLTPSGVTRALLPLEKLRFVKTTKDGRDARRSLAKLTPQGGLLLDDATAVVRDVIQDIAPLQSLSAREGASVLDLLEALRRA